MNKEEEQGHKKRKQDKIYFPISEKSWNFKIQGEISWIKLT